MKSPDTIVYEQVSQMALSCFHYDSLLCKCFPMQKKSDLGDTTWKCSRQHYIADYLHSHLKTKVKLHITVFSEVTEYRTLNMYVSHFYCICSLQFYCNLSTALCKRKNTPVFTTNINSLWVELCTTVNNMAVKAEVHLREIVQFRKHFQGKKKRLEKKYRICLTDFDN